MVCCHCNVWQAICLLLFGFFWQQVAFNQNVFFFFWWKKRKLAIELHMVSVHPRCLQLGLSLILSWVKVILLIRLAFNSYGQTMRGFLCNSWPIVGSTGDRNPKKIVDIYFPLISTDMLLAEKCKNMSSEKYELLWFDLSSFGSLPNLKGPFPNTMTD